MGQALKISSPLNVVATMAQTTGMFAKVDLFHLCPFSCRLLRPQEVLRNGGSEGQVCGRGEEGLHGAGCRQQRLHRGGGAQVRLTQQTTASVTLHTAALIHPASPIPAQIRPEGLRQRWPRPDGQRDQSVFKSGR